MSLLSVERTIRSPFVKIEHPHLEPSRMYISQDSRHSTAHPPLSNPVEETRSPRRVQQAKRCGCTQQLRQLVAPYSKPRREGRRAAHFREYLILVHRQITWGEISLDNCPTNPFGVAQTSLRCCCSLSAPYTNPISDSGARGGAHKRLLVGCMIGAKVENGPKESLLFVTLVLSSGPAMGQAVCDVEVWSLFWRGRWMSQRIWWGYIYSSPWTIKVLNTSN